MQHLVMQCPGSEGTRRDMFDELNNLSDNLEYLFSENPDKVFKWLIGMPLIEGADETFMLKFWSITGRFITDMYKNSLRNRDGIG